MPMIRRLFCAAPWVLALSLAGQARAEGPRPTSGAQLSPSQLFGALNPEGPSAGGGPWQPDPAVRARARAYKASARVDAGLMAGASAQVITPTEFELYTDINDDATYQPDIDVFEDTGVDQRYDWQEPGALGADGQPGRAGVDDDGDGEVDEPDEYLSARSDDLADPNQDNYDRVANPSGTEGNGEFDALALAGFGGLLGVDIRPAIGVHDDIWSRALAVSQDDQAVIFIVNDTVGMLFHWMNPVKRALEADLGVPFDRIVIASTHSHQAPDTVGIWGGPLDYDFMVGIMDGMYAAAVEAYSSREPVQVRSTTAALRACYDPDTLVMKPLSECAESDFVPDNLGTAEGTDQYILQNDLRDPWVRRMDVPVQQFVGASGTVATVVSFDTHPEVLLDENQLISSDYPNYTRAVLEQAFGGVALFFASTVGCQMGALRGAPIPLYDEDGAPQFQAGVTDALGGPVPQWASGAENRARSEGMEVGTAAAQAIAGQAFTAGPQLMVQTEYVDVKISNPIYRLIINYISRLDSFEEQEYVIDAPYCTRLGCIRTPISRVTIGQTTYLTVPGEFPPEYVVGRDASVAPYSQTTDGEWEDWPFPEMPPLIDDVPTRNLMMIGLANNYFGYAVPEADHVGFMNTEHPNYYEEVYAADICFGDSVGNKLLDMLDSRRSFNPRCAYHP